VYDAANDRLYIGLNEALITVAMNRIVPVTHIQPPVLAGVYLDSLDVGSPANSLVIKPGTEKIRFDLHHPFLPLARRHDLYYKLSGFEDDWHVLQGSSQVIYNKLPAGNYELMAKTINPDGYASGETVLIKLEVLPVIWKRPWFIVLEICVLLVSFFYIGASISKRRYRRKLVKLQEEYRLQSERERIARELHDNVGSQLTYLINKIDDDYILLSDKDEADKLGGFARGAMQELRETIWALNKKDIHPGDLEAKIIQLASLYPPGKVSTLFNWNNGDQHPVALKSLQALNIYRIVQESLNNAMKHSRARDIRIQVDIKDTTFHVVITDNGIGFNPEGSWEGYGLRNLKSRAAEMNAVLEIKSEKEKGTVVSLSVPLS
jgi:signal transduction histidine kinase